MNNENVCKPHIMFHRINPTPVLNLGYGCHG